jgi:predicted RNase H-like HicB family nuclease/DNA-binding XRE family transcriptional regulator
MKYHFRYYKDERGGFWGESIEIEGCRSEGDTFEELKKNLTEALSLCLESAYFDKEDFIFPLEDNELKDTNIIAIKPEVNILFANLLKYYRKKHKLSQKNVAERLGYKSVWAYQKLENSKYGNIQLKTLAKIEEIFPEMDFNSILR